MAIWHPITPHARYQPFFVFGVQIIIQMNTMSHGTDIHCSTFVMPLFPPPPLKMKVPTSAVSVRPRLHGPPAFKPRTRLSVGDFSPITFTPRTPSFREAAFLDFGQPVLRLGHRVPLVQSSSFNLLCGCESKVADFFCKESLADDCCHQSCHLRKT